MNKFKIVPKTRAQLQAKANPAQANQPESLPWVLYSTKLFTSNSTTELTFFDRTEGGDLSLTNMEAASVITDPKYFEIESMGLDILMDATVENAADELGALDDIQKLMLVGRSYFLFTMSDKKFGPFPASFLHASGGATGFGWGTLVASNNIQYANNGIFDGGYYVGGSLVIPPNTGFDFKITWPAVTVLKAGNTYLRAWMQGTMHRRVL